MNNQECYCCENEATKHYSDQPNGKIFLCDKCYETVTDNSEDKNKRQWNQSLSCWQDEVESISSDPYFQ